MECAAIVFVRQLRLFSVIFIFWAFFLLALAFSCLETASVIFSYFYFLGILPLGFGIFMSG
jgi:uncharacterized integral membrane protein